LKILETLNHSICSGNQLNLEVTKPTFLLFADSLLTATSIGDKPRSKEKNNEFPDMRTFLEPESQENRSVSQIDTVPVPSSPSRPHLPKISPVKFEVSPQTPPKSAKPYGRSQLDKSPSKLNVAQVAFRPSFFTLYT